ncbi:Crp/Fnr family transcriptional regulator [Paraburkholderia sp. ZP32-5]|uniref:Crp/Fnr family transcriptional regulator n=1 Tax=Paraburkholderia sp. ZP32-5 TaxID=2883245 RepID=UPI001F161355|nr:Crp/Fnr family transcriptional regulator [Paraburkholderia sp. ZP32-5]
MREYSLNASQSLDAVLSPRHAQTLCAAGQMREFDAGEFICHQGDDARDVYLLARGGVKTVMLNSAGQESLLRIHLPGSLLGLIALTTYGMRDVSLIALQRSHVVVIARDAMLQLLRTDGDCAVHVIRLVLDRTRDLHMRVAELSANRVDQRLARALLSLSRPDPEGEADGTVALTHEELAQWINCRRPTVTSCMSRFALAGLIDRSKHRIVIADRTRLMQLVAV